ncbi:SURF1 family protein [Gilvimarinus sp. F26214L]|uniref:SURF1 family protein n=1 Tax=Gilvimarinus sp. DZF01 TaxID=3461371 RepID=UPI004045732F
MMTRIIAFGPLTLRFNWIVATLVLAAVAGLVRLGLWQLDRAGEELAQHESFLEMQEGAPEPIEALAARVASSELRTLQNRQVSLQGRYLNGQSIFLIYQVHEEQLGFEVVTPFELKSGTGTVLVSRGWIAAEGYEQLRGSLPRIWGEQELHAQIHIPAGTTRHSSNEQVEPRWPLLTRHLQLSELQPLFFNRLLPFVVRLNEGQPGVLVRHWAPVRVDAGRNFSYALQWFAMAVALAVVSLLLSSNGMTLLAQRHS